MAKIKLQFVTYGDLLQDKWANKRKLFKQNFVWHEYEFNLFFSEV